MSDYRLKYTGAEIEERLGKVDILEDNQVVVSNDEPSKGSLWIDIDEDDEVILAEINDNDVSDEKTWSSKKINELNDKLTKEISDRQNAINNIKIPSLDGYATENYVQGYAQPKGNYLTQHQDISGKQNKTDNSLKTNSKDVVGAINEISDGVVEINENIDVIGYNVGTSIIVNDSADSAFLGMKLYGKTTQPTTTGKNLLENTAITSEYSGVKFTVNNDKSVTANGTNNSDSALFFTIGEAKLGAGKYIISANLPNGYNSTDNALLTDVNYEFYAGDTPKEFTISEERTVTFYYRIQSGITVNNVTLYPMIRLASITDSTYEPYTGNAPSPSPQYPQPLDSKGKWGNLFNKRTVVKGYELNLDHGNISANPNYFVSDYIPVKYGKSYFVSGKTGISGIALYDSNKSYVGRIENLENESFSISNQLVAYIRTNDLIQDLDSIMFNEGTTALPYRPYTGQLEVESGVYSGNLYEPLPTNMWSNDCELKLVNDLYSLTPTDNDSFFVPHQNAFHLVDGEEYYFNVFYNIKGNGELYLWNEHGAVARHGQKFVYDKTKRYHFELEYYTNGVLYEFKIVISKNPITEFIPFVPKQSHISLVGDGLKGIPVTDASLATYTNEKGQMICADEKNYARSVNIERVHKVSKDDFTGDVTFNQTIGNYTQWIINATNTKLTKMIDKTTSSGATMCNILPLGTNIDGMTNSEGFWLFKPSNADTCTVVLVLNNEKYPNADDVTALLDDIEILFVDGAEIETPLSASELESYKKLHSNYGVTAILNDCDTYTEIDYFKNSPNGSITGQLYTENVELKSKLSALEETVNQLVVATLMLNQE